VIFSPVFRLFDIGGVFTFFGSGVAMSPTASSPRIPLAVKLALTAFVMVLVPVYCVEYTPLNLLYFCDVALGLTLAAVWMESSLLASMGAVGIVLPQTLWISDFLMRLTTGGHLVNMTEYMFDANESLFLRGLSTFHFWLPLMLLWMTWRLGYDGRALRWQTVVMAGTLGLTWLLAADAPGPAGNVNNVFGPGNGLTAIADHPVWLQPLMTYRVLWVGLLMAINFTAVLVPSHLAMRWVFAVRPEKKAERIGEEQGMLMAS
jgi:hypothetical protein